jgi:hypothetical protein
VRVRGPRGPLRLTRAAALLAVALSLSGCGRTAPREAGTSITWSLEPAAPRVGLAELTFELRDAAGAALTGAAVRVEGHMTHAGMRPVIARATETTPGAYAAAIEFTMAGDWVLLVHVVRPDGGRVEHRIDVPRVEPAR